MNIEIVVINRFGITHEVLACLAEQSQDLAALEVVAEHIYIDLPNLTPPLLGDISNALLTVEGVQRIRRIDLLPKERRRRHLDALLSTMPDPVFAIDAQGDILSANAAATKPLKLDEQALQGRPITDFLIDNQDYPINLNFPADQTTEVSLAEQTYLLERKPIFSHSDQSEESSSVDQMIRLQATHRLGHQISKIQGRGSDGFASIAGESRPLMNTKERALRFASIHAPLLIQGETGTGKELFARAIHQASPWHASAFLTLNCAALPENLVESELFGYAPGAFSGADRSGKPGLLELADGGTAFLDEIGEMSVYVQAKLLRFIQDGSFRRVGGKEERKVKVRIICASHRNLEAMVSQSMFREDLMYRLNVLNLQLPALRDRRSDIAQLSTLFVKQAAAQIECPPPRLSAEALDILQSHPWPGNVRQLENLLFRTVALCQTHTIGAEELHNGGIDADTLDTTTQNEPENWKAAQQTFEADLLRQLYPRYPSSRKLAKRLGVSHTTIADKLRLHNITSA